MTVPNPLQAIVRPALGIGAFRVGASLSLVAAFAMLSACDKKKSDKAETKAGDNPIAATPAVPRFTEVDKVALMEQHYNAAIVAHDMLIAGDLEGFRSQIGSLAAQELPANAPEPWRFGHEKMQGAAEEASASASLEEAAGAMGYIVETCGACHAAHPAGPVYQNPTAPTGDEVGDKMQGHQWATERLWEGVTGPVDGAWTRGATALANSRVFKDSNDASLLELESGMRKLGEDALKLNSLSERAQLYGTLLATCGSCHQQAKVTLPQKK